MHPKTDVIVVAAIGEDSRFFIRGNTVEMVIEKTF